MATRSEKHDALIAAMARVYVGDSVYAWHDESALWIATNNGMGDTNAICLERDVLSAIIAFVERIDTLAAELRETPERHPDEDDGRTYADPRDEMNDRLDRD